MLFSLKTKLSLSYVLIILFCVAIVSISSNIMLERQFKNYVIKQQEQKANDIVSLINQRSNKTGNWDIDYIEELALNALENGMIISVLDADDNLIWDAAIHNDGLCQDMLLSMSQNMKSRFSETEGGYEEKIFNMTDKSKKIGSIIVGYYGPFYYTDSDLNFINTINKMLIWAGATSLLLALFIGAIMSKQISKPIARVIDKAHMISEGSYGERIYEKSNTKEIGMLIETINHLGETLKKQEALGKQLTSDISHELRTPLTTIQGNLEAVLDGVWELDKNRIEVLHEEILRINRLVANLGKLTKFESENLKLNRTEFDISKLIQDTIKIFENEFIKENKKIELIGNSEILYADMDKISQVIVNIISNSLKFTNHGAEVLITVVSDRKSLMISFKDSGIGISEEDLPNIFERFYRAEKSRNRLMGGAGIGLSIVKSIVIAHNGTVSVNSIINKGSEFIITLPKTDKKY